MRIIIATDAWHPQVNGVVVTLQRIGQELQSLGHEVLYITPQEFPTIPCPTYHSIRLALLPKRGVDRIIREFKPEAIHIATEGPIGHSVRNYCLHKKLKFTTSFHTQFPEYLRLRAPIPIAWTYAYLRRFHGLAARTMVPTRSLQQRLTDYHFNNVVLWSRGVDTAVFYPRDKQFLDLPRPIYVCTGRVAVEKNIEAFLDLDLPGSKLVIGDGPDLLALRSKYPAVHFIGYKKGDELANYVAAADVFVFPSRTDTFGLVMLEAMACGVPVAAYPVCGPVDVVINGKTGILNEDLRQAALDAIKLNSTDCVEYARSNSWQDCAKLFASYLEPFNGMASPKSVSTYGLKALHG
jgi:glycosyltransferase involved in cell wall biosynthesis